MTRTELWISFIIIISLGLLKQDLLSSEFLWIKEVLSVTMLLGFLFFPLNLYFRLSQKKMKVYCLALLLYSLGVLFKIQHWPGKPLFLSFYSFSTVIFGFTLLLQSKPPNLLNKLSGVFFIIFSVHFFSSEILYDNGLPLPAIGILLFFGVYLIITKRSFNPELKGVVGFTTLLLFLEWFFTILSTFNS